MSELFREAFRIYYAQQACISLQEIGEYADSRNSGYAEADIPRLIQEVRSERPARKQTRTSQKLWVPDILSR
jgi:hypothetical protein